MFRSSSLVDRLFNEMYALLQCEGKIEEESETVPFFLGEELHSLLITRNILVQNDIEGM